MYNDVWGCAEILPRIFVMCLYEFAFVVRALGLNEILGWVDVLCLWQDSLYSHIASDHPGVTGYQ